MNHPKSYSKLLDEELQTNGVYYYGSRRVGDSLIRLSRLGPQEIPTLEKAFMVHTSHWCWYR